MPENESEQTQEVVAAPRNQSETLEWLSKQTGTKVEEVNGRVVISFGRQIEERLNCLAPVSQVAQVDPNFSPNPRVVTLNIDSDAFPVKGGFSLNKVGLSKLADLAQVEIIGQQMQYMGNQGVRAIVTARMRGPDGTWKLDSQTKTVRFEVLKREVERRLKAAATKHKKAQPTEDDIAKAYDEELTFCDEKASTKAFLRCVRKLLSVKGTYSKAELAKPFLVITWSFTPDWDNPRVAEMLALQYREGTEELYGGETDAPPTDVDVLPPPGQHAAAALEAAERDADALETAEDSAAQGTSGEPEPLPGEATEPTGADGDPEAWDLAEEELRADPQGVVIEKPTEHFTPNAGPFKGVDVEQIVQSPEGKVWLAKAVKLLKDPAKALVAIGWLEYGTSGEVTADTLDEFVESSDV